MDSRIYRLKDYPFSPENSLKRVYLFHEKKGGAVNSAMMKVEVMKYDCLMILETVARRIRRKCVSQSHCTCNYWLA